MIIKELKIKNFRSYYGDSNNFSFSDGLTLILGDNGDGKTTFFEALGWLLNTTDKEYGSEDNISEMRKSEMAIGEMDEVSVYISFDHDGEKSVEKSFTFECIGQNKVRTNKHVYRGYESNGIEREPVSGKQLIDRCYDAFIQRFSMFKGESELNVFDNPHALKELVDKFSDIRDFDTLVENSRYFADNATASYEKEMKSDDKVAKEAGSLSYKLRKNAEQITEVKKDIKEKEDSLSVYNFRLTELESKQDVSENYKGIEDRRKAKAAKAEKLMAQIALVDYNHSLLDKYWVLCDFADIFTEFQQKCSALSKEKRTQEKNFDKKQAEEIGKLKAIKEIQGALVNGSTELPWYLPDQQTMEEMINDKICKVCGRPVEEHSDAYHFMVNKLNEYKKHVEREAKLKADKKAIEEKTLFKTNHIEQLHSLSISLSGESQSRVASVPQEILDRIELVDRLKSDLKSIKEDIHELEEEKARLLIQANVSESALEKDFKDIKGLFEQRTRAEVRLAELNARKFNLEKESKELKAQFDALNPQNSQVKVFQKVKNTLEAIAKAFAEAKKKNLCDFLVEMENKANGYLSSLSANDFHGKIRLIQTANDSTQIKLFSSNGPEIKSPSGSQKTVMYISVLFAISDFTEEKRDEDYPLIFDAATSSFGDLKEDDFYNVINRIKKQCIIVTKDFITKGKVRIEDVDKLDCPVYRIKKADGFDQDNLATIRTNVSKIKD